MTSITEAIIAATPSILTICAAISIFAFMHFYFSYKSISHNIHYHKFTDHSGRRSPLKESFKQKHNQHAADLSLLIRAIGELDEVSREERKRIADMRKAIINTVKEPSDRIDLLKFAEEVEAINSQEIGTIKYLKEKSRMAMPNALG